MLLHSDVVRDAAREIASQIAGRPIKPGQCLITSGLIDSLSVLKLISALEKRLNVILPPETLQPEDFDHIDLIVETVQRVAKPRDSR